MKKQIKAKNSLDFLREHPAFSSVEGDSLFDGLWFSMQACCKHGNNEHAGRSGITVWGDNPKFKEYKDLFKEEKGLSDKLQSVNVPYERYFGKPWKFDHMEYWYELTFFVFKGNPYIDKETWDFKNWDRYAGPEGGERSFEDMLIKIEQQVKKIYGDFNSNKDFLTEEEKTNNKIVDPFCRKKKINKNYNEVTFNPRFISVSKGLINNRWVKWFMNTKYAKDNWGHDFKEWQLQLKKIQTMEPLIRKNILSKYSKTTK
jgi:hypothetical protein